MLITIYSIFKFWREVRTTQSNSWGLELGIVQAKYKGTLVIHLGKKCSMWWWWPLKNGSGFSWSSNQDQKGACLNSIHAIWVLFLPFLVWWRKGHCLSLWLWLSIPQCWISRQKRDETQLHFNKADLGPRYCLGLWFVSEISINIYQEVLLYKSPGDDFLEKPSTQSQGSNPLSNPQVQHIMNSAPWART